jgi:hypothetical protein
LHDIEPTQRKHNGDVSGVTNSADDNTENPNPRHQSEPGGSLNSSQYTLKIPAPRTPVCARADRNVTPDLRE